MADFRTGDTLVWFIGPILNGSGAAVTGASWSAVNALKPDGTTFAPTYSEIGGGDYKATVVGSQRGRWWLHSTATVSSVVYTDAGSIDVDDDWAVTLPGAYALGTAGAAVGRGIVTTPSSASSVSSGGSGTTLSVTRGDTFTYTVTIGSPALNLTDCTLWFTVKLASGIVNADASDATALVANYWVSGGSAVGIAVATPASGQAVITIAPSVTATFDQRRRYAWDLQMQSATSAVTTIDSGTISISDDVTQRLTTP